MPIGNLTSQMSANLHLDPLDHFVRERLRVRHYLRYMDDLVLLGPPTLRLTPGAAPLCSPLMPGASAR